MNRYNLSLIILLLINFIFSTSNLYSQTWQSYDSLRRAYQKKQSYDSALVYANKSLQFVKDNNGENDTTYADMLKALRGVYYDLNNYKKAIEYGTKEKDLRKVLKGNLDPSYAYSCMWLGYFYKVTNNFAECELLYIEAVNIWKELKGEKDPDYLLSLNNLATLYQNMGNNFKAEPILINTMNIRKEVLGENNRDFAISLNNLGSLYETMGNYPEAEQYFLKAKNIFKEVLGDNHTDYATCLNNLAGLYNSMSNYSASENLSIEAQKIWKEVLGEKSPDYATSLNNLASLYWDIGNYPAAEPLLLESKNIWKEVLGEKHAKYASSLNNLASLYKETGNLTLSESLFIESRNIRKELFGEKHPDYALSSKNLASLYKQMENYKAAEPLYIEAKNIYKELFGEKHPDYAGSLNNIGSLLEEMNNYTEAEPLYIETMNIRKDILGAKHPSYAISLLNIANLYQKTGRYNLAEPIYLESLDIINLKINQNSAFLSEKERELYFKTQENTFNNFYSFALKRKTENPEISNIVFNNVINNKGILLKSSTAMRTAILNSKDTNLINEFTKWIDLKKEVSKLYSIEITKRKRDPELLEQQANITEKELVKKSQTFSEFDKVQKLTWESVKNNLKPKEAAVEFIQFPIDKKKDTIIYCALIITPNCKYPEMIKLFDENQILEIINSKTGNNLNQVNNLYGINKKINDSLYKLIWEPLEKYLEGVKTIFYSPDGILHKISFASIGKGKNKLICDIYNLHQVSSSGKIAMPEKTIINNDLTACIFGGVDFSTDTTVNVLWKYLPGTLKESNTINNKLNNGNIQVKTFLGKEATELNFKKLYSIAGIYPTILHIATHGFFYPDPEQYSKERKLDRIEEGKVIFRGGNTGFGLWQFVKNKNPLMRSGLVFAGANNVWNQRFIGEGEDGVLTAQEVTQLDMSKTKLVVLSACETGLGDIKGSEGVYGLQRAFKMAGVKFIIMSLWQVPDKETEEFMITFYNKLLKSNDIRKSFNETQKDMRKKYDPYYWGAFVLVE